MALKMGRMGLSLRSYRPLLIHVRNQLTRNFSFSSPYSRPRPRRPAPTPPSPPVSSTSIPCAPPSFLTHSSARPSGVGGRRRPCVFPVFPTPPRPPQPSLVASTKTFGAEALYSAIERLSSGIAARHPSAQKTVLLGIANGGIELARRLSQTLKLPVGTLDISFHRDDFGAKPIPKEFTPTIIPFDVTGATVILVDDVLFSGRTVKAALDELFDHGRPAKVELAILVDPGGPMLPLPPHYSRPTLQPTPPATPHLHLD